MWDIEPPGRGRGPHIIFVPGFLSVQFCSLLCGSVLRALTSLSDLVRRRVFSRRMSSNCLVYVVNRMFAGGLSCDAPFPPLKSKFLLTISIACLMKRHAFTVLNAAQFDVFERRAFHDRACRKDVGRSLADFFEVRPKGRHVYVQCFNLNHATLGASD